MKSCYIFIICCTLLLTSCTPKTSPEEAYKIGLIASQPYIEHYGEVKTPVATAYIRYIENRLASAIENKRFLYPQVIILDTNQPLALSAGGGFVLISKSVVKSVANEAELAFIISHELAHQQLEHIVNAGRYQEQQELDADEYGLGIMALAGYDPRVAPHALSFLHHRTQEPSMIASHPSINERIYSIRRQIDQSGWNPPGTINRRGFNKFRKSL